MRKALTMLGALAALALGSLFAVPAQAQSTPVCTSITSSITVYPFNGTFKQCGLADGQHANGMAGTINALSVKLPDLFDRLKNVNNGSGQPTGAKFYIFQTADEYHSYMSANGIAHTWPQLPGTVGITEKDGTGKPTFTALFVYAAGSPSPSPPNGYMDDVVGTVNFVTVHEAGHWADWFYRTMVNTSGPIASNSNMWNDLKARDYINLNALPICGTGGLFNGSQDQGYSGNPPSSTRVYVCSGTSHASLPVNSRYSTANPETILILGWNHIFWDYGEMFADEVANEGGQADKAPFGAIKFFDNANFNCTAALTRKLAFDGRLPTKTELSRIAKKGGASGSAMCPQSGSGWPSLAP